MATDLPAPASARAGTATISGSAGRAVRFVGVALAAALLFGGPAALAGDMRTQRVHFARGATSATVQGTIKGQQTVDYLLGAQAGQTLNVSMATRSTAVSFNIMAPGETEVTFFNGSVSGNQYEGALSKSGDYRIRVYLDRAAARRGEAATYRLEMIISAAATPATTSHANAAAQEDSALRVGQGRFDATGQVPCAQRKGQPMGQCNFGVARDGSGTAAVAITLPDGRKRTIFFVNGRATSADTSQADGYGAFKARRQGDLSIIQVGQERFEIPDAVPLGG